MMDEIINDFAKLNIGDGLRSEEGKRTVTLHFTSMESLFIFIAVLSSDIILFY